MNERDEARLRSVLSEGQRDRFDVGFADRVLTRLAVSPANEPELAADLVRYCRRAIPAAIAAALLLAIHNVVRTRGDASSPVGAVLGLTRATNAAAQSSATASANTMSVESLYGLGSLAAGGD